MECDFLQHEIHKFLQIKPYNDKYEKKDNLTINVLTFFYRLFDTLFITDF